MLLILPEENEAVVRLELATLRISESVVVSSSILWPNVLIN